MALVSGLPADLPASICIVLHISPEAPGRLPHVLSRHTSLPVTHATDSEAIQPGHIYTAPPDHHAQDVHRASDLRAVLELLPVR